MSFIGIKGDEFKYPKIKYETVNPLTPTAGISRATDRYGDFLDAYMTGQGRPGQSFNDFVSARPGGFDNAASSIKQSPYLDEAAGVARNVVSGLEDMRATGAPVDTSMFYDAAKSNLQNEFDRFLYPKLKESLGLRGARYGTDIVRQGGETYGDLSKQINVEAAKSGIASQEAARGRRLGAADITGRQAPTLANIASIVQALSEANRKFAFETDYAREDPRSYFPALQNYINSRPIFPQILAGGQPTYIPEWTVGDQMEQLSRIYGNVGGVGGAGGGGRAG